MVTVGIDNSIQAHSQPNSPSWQLGIPTLSPYYIITIIAIFRPTSTKPQA